MGCKKWKLAKPPNYKVNLNLMFPYSEESYHIGKVTKIPMSSHLIEHVDYWGQGKIATPEKTTGFAYSYNVNYMYKLVSKGDDVGRKIPNRIPILEDCDTSRYIKDNSVKLVTVVEADIDETCAEDIARIVNDAGKVIVYGYEDDSESVKNLEDMLKSKGLFYYADYDLCEKLKISHLKHRVYLNFCETLYNHVKNGEYKQAVKCTKFLEKSDRQSFIKDVVDKLLKVADKCTMSYAYKLWNEGAKEIVLSCFPPEFKQIFDGDAFRMVNKDNFTQIINAYDASLIKDVPQFLIYGYTKNIEHWKVTSVWKEEAVVFKFKYTTNDVGSNSVYNTQNLKLEYKEFNIKTEDLYQLQPLKINNDLLFIIYDYEDVKGNDLYKKLQVNEQVRDNGNITIKQSQFLDMSDVLVNLYVNNNVKEDNSKNNLSILSDLLLGLNISN